MKTAQKWSGKEGLIISTCLPEFRAEALDYPLYFLITEPEGTALSDCIKSF